MKKSLLTFLVSTLIMMSASAQDSTFISHTYLGIKAGYNYGTVTMAHALQRINSVEGYLPGFHFGLIGINYLEKNIGLQVELNYTQKGYSQITELGGPKYENTLKYIELPIYMNVYVGRKKTRLFFNLGTYAKYLIGSTPPSGTPGDNAQFDLFPYEPDRDRKLGYGLIGGGGIYRDFSFGTIMIQGEFAYGFSNILDPVTEDSGIPNISNLLTSYVSVGYMIRLDGMPQKIVPRE
ncbi:MAG: PorT family protein [Cyclobacteriaceae bacterium]